MENLIIIVPRDIDLLNSFKNIDKKYIINKNEYNDLIIQYNDSHIFINNYLNYQEEYELNELKKIEQYINNPKFYTLEYKDIDFAYQILLSIKEIDKLIIDDDHGNIYYGQDFFKMYLNKQD